MVVCPQLQEKLHRVTPICFGDLQSKFPDNYDVSFCLSWFSALNGWSIWCRNNQHEITNIRMGVPIVCHQVRSKSLVATSIDAISVHGLVKARRTTLHCTMRRYNMDTFSALLALFDGIHQSPVKGTIMRSFDVYFVVGLNKLLKTVELPGIWNAMTLMWRHCTVICFMKYLHDLVFIIFDFSG